MNNLQRCVYAMIPIAATIAMSSCKNTSSEVDLPPPVVYVLPVVQPLKMSNPVKLNWDSIKSVPVHPVVKPFDLDKLPAQSYDTAGFKPFKYPVEETKFDYNGLPEKDLDIDKLPSHPFKFTTEKLPPPKLIHAGTAHLKDFNLSLFELGEAQGLAGKTITCLFNDRDGFLWIATMTGLYRYDGEDLLLYIPVTAPHYVWSMEQDTTGRLWLPTGSYGGDLEVLDPISGTLMRTNKSLGLNSNYSWRILKDKRQRMWEIAGPAINIIDPKTQTVQSLDTVHGLADSTSNKIVQDANHRLWIGSYKGVEMIDLENRKTKYFDKSNGLSSDSVDNLLFDRSGRLWLMLHGGLMNILDLQKKTIETIKEAQHPNTYIPSLFQDNKGRIWAGATGTGKFGVEVIDPENRTEKNIKNINGLNSEYILSVIQDYQGQVWIGTANGGLNMIDVNNTVLERTGRGRVSFVVEDKQGLIWDLYDFGIALIDKKNKTVRHLGAKQGLSNDTVGEMMEINGKIYLPTASGLNIIDRQAKTISYIGKAEGLSGRLLQDLAADKAGRIWMIEVGGLCVYDPKAGIVKHLGKAQGLKAGTYENMQVDPRGKIWLNSTANGVEMLDPYAFTIQTLNNNVAALRMSQGGFLFPEKSENIWISTSKGIYIADLGKKTLTNFAVPQGLVDDRVATLLQSDNKIYASTLGGITIITPPAEGIVTDKKWGVQSFGNEYGLKKINPYYAMTDALSSDGHFLWGDYGVSVLDLSKKDTSRPPAYISGMNIMDQPANFSGRSPAVADGIAWTGVSGPNNMPVNLELPHDQNYVQFNFGTLNLRTHDTTWYTYKLVGKDTGWNAKTALDHSRNYFNLAPGKYTFEVASKSSDNGWSKPARIRFIVRPPWWQTWWAYLLYALLFSSVLWGFVTLRSRQLVKEKHVLEHKVHVRTEEVLQQKEEIEAQRDNLDKAFKELNETQTQLVQREKMASLGELTAGIAHEIQNPLNFVNNFSEVNTELIDELQQEIGKGNFEEVRAIAADIKENQEKISQHGKRADFIVKGMLLHSRNNSGERQLTNLNVLADEFFKLSYHGLRAKDKNFNAEMTTHFAENLPAITIVQQDIGRVLLNLFNNAFYAVNQKQKTAGSDYKPEVSVSTSSENGQIIIRVKDNGTGISDSIREKIMQPFFTTKPTGEGTGLGLSLAYDIVVKGHNGTIQVNSTEGEGSEFIIQLPIDKTR